MLYKMVSVVPGEMLHAIGSVQRAQFLLASILVLGELSEHGKSTAKSIC